MPETFTDSISNTDMPDSVSIIVPVTALDDVTNIDMTVVSSLPAAWQQGMVPSGRQQFYGQGQGVVSVIIGLLLAMCLCFRNIQRVWGTLAKRLWNIRSRQNYDDTTVAEKRTIVLLLLVAVCFISLIVTAALSTFQPQIFARTFNTTLCITTLVAAYFLFQYGVYTIIGYTFSSGELTQMWIQGFTASMAILGVTLVIPGLAILFYPDVTVAAVIVGIFLYICARLTFIYKGFRIFYTNESSLVYFILYLCSLEIIPIIIIYRLASDYCF